MNTGALRSLTIEHLRGSVTPFSLTFETGKKLTVIYGENGTGKSTICDAFEFLGNGRVGSLDKRGLGKTRSYWSSLGKSTGDILVTIETADGACRAMMGRTEVVVTPAEKRPKVDILRRAQILSLLEATAAERYEAIRRFIDVSGIEASEGALRQVIKEVNATLNEAATRIQENLDAIRHFWEEAQVRHVHPLAWAEQESTRDPGAFTAEVKALDALRHAYERLVGDADKLDDAERRLREAKNVLSTAEATAAEWLGKVPADTAAVVDVLEAAKRHLDAHPAPAACPLCESTQNVDGLVARIEERLNAFAALRDAQNGVRARREEVERATRKLSDVHAEADHHGRQFMELTANRAWQSDVSLPDAPVPAALSEWRAWLGATSDLPEKWRKVELARTEDAKFLGTLKRTLHAYNENVRAQKELDALLPRLDRALEIMAEERRRFTDHTLAAIATEVGRLYEAVHPGEGLNKISLELDPKKRASLEIGATFHGTAGAPPQAYFSDSHLDTLGLCIFLALAGRDAPAEKILVLDDVLTSVDQPHADRVIEMLYEEGTRFRHCLITTHFKPWREKYRWGQLKTGDCQFIELTAWNPLSGLALVGTVPELGRLRRLLEDPAPDPQLVCAKAGVVLEAALDFLTTQYRCAVPRDAEGRYTLGDLLPAVSSKLRKALVVETVMVSADGTKAYTPHNLGPHLDALEAIAKTRNVVGCHFNELAFDLLDADGLKLGQMVLDLMELLTDDGRWPKSDKSGKYWATAGETRRLYPLKKPS